MARRRINLLTDSEYCERLFGNNSFKTRCNKVLIQRVRCLLTAVLRSHHDLAISLVKAHTGHATREAAGNATADRLSARGRTGFSGATVGPSPVPPSRLRRRSPRGPSNPRRRLQRCPLPSRVLCPSHFAFHLSVPYRDILLRVARVYRDISPAPSVTLLGE